MLIFLSHTKNKIEQLLEKYGILESKPACDFQRSEESKPFEQPELYRNVIDSLLYITK